MTANVNVTKVLFRRGNTAQNASYTGINGEVTVDTQAKTLRIHDGVTAGGFVVSGGGGGSYGNANVKSYLASFDGNINPSANVTYSLGSATQQWKDLWVSNATIYFNSVPLSTDATGNITYNGNPLVSFVDGNLIVGGEVVSGGGGNPFDQDLNANSAVTFYTVGATVINVSQINGTNPGDELVIQANNHNWTFGTDGNLTLPLGGDIVNSSGESVLGGGGNIAGLTSSVGNQAASHGDTVYSLTLNSGSNDDDPLIEVYKGTGDNDSAISIGQSNSGFRQANVIAIGNDDVGYDALPGGVYIGYQAGWNDTEQPQGLHSIAIGSKAAYYFAPNNSITLNATGNELNPDESGLFIKPIRAEEYDDVILYYNPTSGEVTYANNTGVSAPVTVGNVAAGAEGALWYNTEDGRTYVYALDTWIDASPAVVPGNMVGYGQDGNITLNEDARINYANGVSIINSVYGDSQVASFLDDYTGNIAKIGATPLSISAASVRLTSDNETWTFAPDGVVTLPNGMSIESYGTTGVNASIDIGGDDTRIRIDDNGAPPGFSITTNATGGMASRTWLFDPDGNISFPDGTTQTTAYTGGAGGTGNALVNGAYTVALQANGVLTIGANATISNDGEFRLWATDTDITVYRNGQDGYGVKPGNIEVYTDNGLRTLTNSNGFELKTGNIIIPNDKGVVFANGVNILSTIVGITSINTSVATSTINDESGDFSYGSLSYDYAVNGVTSGGFTIDYSAPLVHGNVDVNVGNVIVTNIDAAGTIGANVIQVLSDLTSFGASPAPRIYGFSSIATTGSAVNEGNISASGNLVASRNAYISGNVIAGNVVSTGNVTAQNFIGNISITGNVQGTSANVDLVAGSYTWTFNNAGNLVLPGNTFAVNYANGTAVTLDRVYLLEAYANVTYTLPGSFTEDPCRYSVVSSNVNVSSAWFNTSTYTFTPQKAGYWEITASYDVYRNTEASMAIKKNNSIVAAAGSFNAVVQQITKIIYLNGSTDYIDIVNVGGAALSRSQFEPRSWFQARWIGE
jgi:hypothetical protein